MQKKLELDGGKIVYDFNDEAEYQSKKFISFHKVTKFKDQVKHQNLTVKTDDWPAFCEFMAQCIEGVEPREIKAGELPF